MTRGTHWARIAVRQNDDEDAPEVILGKNFGAFENGKVYEIERIAGALTIREVGVSAATHPFDEAPVRVGADLVTWGLKLGALILSGYHLYTRTEIRKLVSRRGK